MSKTKSRIAKRKQAPDDIWNGVTNPKNEATTLAYDTNGHLSSVTGTLAGSTTALGYDAYGRLNSVTDSEGYQVTAGGTTEQTTYDRLDVQRTK